MKLIAACILAAAATAAEVQNIQGEHFTPNENYDHSDAEHYHYGGD